MNIPLQVTLGKVPRISNGMHVISGGTKIYIRNGFKHRETGPAEIRRDGYQAWFKHGKLHRKEGPAVIYPNDDKEYWIEGKLIKTEKHKP